jgi:hypothetical protein
MAFYINFHKDTKIIKLVTLFSIQQEILFNNKKDF